MAHSLSHHEALIFVMVTMSAADSTMTDNELQRIGTIVQNLPVFEDFDPARLVQVSRTAAERLNSEDDLETILDDVVAALPRKLYETAYALAVDVAAADLSVEPEEIRLLDMLQDKLNIDALAVAAIQRAARARFTTV